MSRKMSKTGCITCRKSSWLHHANDDLRPTFKSCSHSTQEIEDNCIEYESMGAAAARIVEESINRYGKDGKKL